MHRNKMINRRRPRFRDRSKSPLRFADACAPDYRASRRGDRQGRHAYTERSRRRSSSQSSSDIVPTRRSKNNADVMDLTQPKHFTRPLTCFFWKQNGFCRKRDADCIYAHWDTGYEASAPIALAGASPTGKGCVAGKTAQQYISVSLKSPTITNLDKPDTPSAKREEEDELRIKDETFAQKEAQLQAMAEALAEEAAELARLKAEVAELNKTCRLKEKEMTMREKTLERKEDALEHAPAIGLECTNCTTAIDEDGKFELDLDV